MYHSKFNRPSSNYTNNNSSSQFSTNQQKYCSQRYYFDQTSHSQSSSPTTVIAISQFINAAIQNDVHLIDTYIQQFNIPVDALDNKGYTALIYAACNGNVNVVRRLVELNANVDYQEPNFHNTALHFAAQCGHTRTAEVLINNGNANKNILNLRKKTPFDLALDFGHGNNKIMKALFFPHNETSTTYQNQSTLKRSASSTTSLESRACLTELDANNNHIIDDNNMDLDNNNNNRKHLKKSQKNSNSNKNNSNNSNNKKDVSYLPNPILLERFAQYGCYYLVGDGFGLSLLAKNGSTHQMIVDSAMTLGISINDITTLIVTLQKLIDDLESKQKFTTKEYENIDPNHPDHQRVNNLFAFNVWRKDNCDKILKMINWLQNWKLEPSTNTKSNNFNIIFDISQIE